VQIAQRETARLALIVGASCRLASTDGSSLYGPAEVGNLSRWRGCHTRSLLLRVADSLATAKLRCIGHMFPELPSY